MATNFHKNFIYVIRTFVFNILAQRVHVSGILRHFFQLYPTHSRSVYDPTGNDFSYGSLPKTSNTLNIRTLKKTDKDNLKMVPKILNSG